MTVKDIEKKWKYDCVFAMETGMSPGCLWNWRKRGIIPLLSQLRLERRTNGELKANLNDFY